MNRPVTSYVIWYIDITLYNFMLANDLVFSQLLIKDIGEIRD